MSPLSRILKPSAGHHVTVVGLARSGEAAARWLVHLGCVVRVTEMGTGEALEERAEALRELGVEVELGKHTKSWVTDAHLVVTSPGVPPTAEPLQWALASNVPVMSELELGLWFANRQTIAVTGSNGKSTTVHLIGQMFEAADLPVVVCGNVGTPICEVLKDLTPHTWMVVEVSSFQLEHNISINPHIACILNVSPNHLDRHGSFEAYRDTKVSLFSKQAAHAWRVLNTDDPGSQPIRHLTQAKPFVSFGTDIQGHGATLEAGNIVLHLRGMHETLCATDALPIPGKHFVTNALAATTMAGLAGVPAEAIKTALLNFKPLPHRQEQVATIKGTLYINDSKATTVDSGLAAIEAAPGPVVLIAGGRDKGSDFSVLANFKDKLKALVLFGEHASKIAKDVGEALPTTQVETLSEAVDKAAALAETGDVVLFSPMCTSFDQFKNFEDRGQAFVETVTQMRSRTAIS